MPDRLAPPDSLPLRALLREDYDAYDRRWSRPGFQAVALHRIGRRTQGSRHPVARVAHRVAKGLLGVVRNVYGIEVGLAVDIGRRVVFAHQGLIVVNDASRIGNDCLIRHGVTLGARSDEHAHEAPVLEDRVEVGVNAVIVGAVVVGEGTMVGPSALVFRDVPPGSKVLAAPAEVRGRGPRPT